MKAAIAHLARLLLVAALAVLSQCGTPWAQALSPPTVDSRWLPRAAVPAPPRPAVQREACAPIGAPTDPADRAQPADLGLPQVRQLSRGAGQRVAVIDTGVAAHPQLPRLIAGGDYVSTGDGTQDCDAHGTMVAGIIAAVDSGGALGGVAPDASVIGIRQSSAKFGPLHDRTGPGVGDVETMAEAVRTAADLGASVVNISSVACVAAGSALDDRALGAALAYAVDVKNVVVVAAAGNTGGNGHCPSQRANPTWQTTTVAVSPAWYDDYVLTVGSVDAQGAPSAFTLAGPWVDVAATGEGLSALGSTPLSGTSYAAPIVSGIAALIRARFPELTARQVMSRIESTAHHPPAGWDPVVGHGTVDALAAVSTGTVGQAPAAAAATPAPGITAAQRTTPASPDRHARDAALRGAGGCLLALIGIAATTRLRHARRDGVAGH